MNYDFKNRATCSIMCAAISLISSFAIKAKAVTTPSINAVEQRQTLHVTGTVLDSNGESVIGATVRVIGEKQATITDMDGKFKIDAPQVLCFNSLLLAMNPKKLKFLLVLYV